jgi:hypothetical protein
MVVNPLVGIAGDALQSCVIASAVDPPDEFVAATGNAWTYTEINSLQIGYRSTSSNVRVHQLCAEVLVQI